MKYLFKAEFIDGSSYDQHPEDLPLAGYGNGSSFTDINERVIDGEVKTFSLIGDNHIWLVDLIDGHFEVDGLKFEVNTEIINKPLSNYRLIYFRRTRQTNVLNSQGESISHSSEIVGYRFGWQANDQDGKNYQQILEIN